MMATQVTEHGSVATDVHGLLLSPSFDGVEWDCCASLLHPDHDRDTSVIVVAYNETPEDLAERWRASGGPVPKHFGAIFANSGMTDSRGLTRRLREAFEDEDVMVGAAVVSPGDLTRINIEVTEMLGMWGHEGEHVTLCITSLTTLLQYTEISRVFRFLHATISTFKAAPATVSTHYHVDPGAVDDQDVARVRSLMNDEIDVRTVATE